MICPYCKIIFDEFNRHRHQLDMTTEWIVIICPKAPISNCSFTINENKLSDPNQVREYRLNEK